MHTDLLRTRCAESHLGAFEEASGETCSATNRIVCRILGWLPRDRDVLAASAVVVSWIWGLGESLYRDLVRCCGIISSAQGRVVEFAVLIA